MLLFIATPGVSNLNDLLATAAVDAWKSNYYLWRNEMWSLHWTHHRHEQWAVIFINKYFFTYFMYFSANSYFFFSFLN